MAFPEAWEETALVAITKLSGSDIEFAAITETIDISEPDYSGESINNLAGGRIWKQTPQEDGEITLEMYPIELDTTSGVGLYQQFNGGTADTAEPLANDTAWPASVDRTRDKFRVTVLWTNDVLATTANGATTGSTDGIRFSAMLCRLVSLKTSFTDGIVKSTATFKFPAMNKAGTVKCFRWDSGDQTAIAALSTYDDEDSWA